MKSEPASDGRILLIDVLAAARQDLHCRGVAKKVHKVAIVVFNGVQSLDFVGPLEVFDVASRGNPAARYDITVTGLDQRTRTSSGLNIETRPLHRVRGPFHTLIVPGGDGTRSALLDTDLLHHVRRLAKRATRVASVCTGAFLLAELGLLDGRRAATHWEWAEVLGDMYPAVSVEADAIYVKDEPIWTSAGVTAGMDLALAMLAEDLGQELALSVARQLVMFVHRTGSQSQFSAQLKGQFAENDAIRGLQSWIYEHLEQDLRVDVLASQVAMSPRNFARVFSKEVGTTPAAFVERTRVDAARRMLESTRLDLDAIAVACGLSSPQTLRRTFHRHVGICPSTYRARFFTRSPS